MVSNPLIALASVYSEHTMNLKLAVVTSATPVLIKSFVRFAANARLLFWVWKI